jgi:hypothetical protein
LGKAKEEISLRVEAEGTQACQQLLALGKFERVPYEFDADRERLPYELSKVGKGDQRSIADQRIVRVFEVPECTEWRRVELVRDQHPGIYSMAREQAWLERLLRYAETADRATAEQAVRAEFLPREDR